MNTYQQAPGTLSAEVADSLIVLSAELKYVELDDVGASIWTALDQRRTVGQIAGILSAEFDADIVEIEPDVERFVGSLVELGLVVCEE
jgi:hypothetical protein